MDEPHRNIYKTVRQITGEDLHRFSCSERRHLARKSSDSDIDDIIHDLNVAVVFSKIDLNKAFHQVGLHQDSRPITMFTTPIALFRYKRLFFGCSAATEMLQFVMQQILNGVTNVRVICDDILVFGKSQRQNNEALRESSDVCQRVALH